MGHHLIHFSVLDAFGLILFCGFIVGIGAFTKLKKNSFLEFLAAGRALTLPALVMTLVSTWYGGVLGVGESVSYYGIGTWLLLGFPYYVFAIIYAYVLAGKVREGDDLSIPQRLESQFGKQVGFVGAILVFLLATPAANVYMLGVLIHLLTGIGTSIAIVLAAVLGLLFLFRGGLVADVRLGIVAFIATYIGFIVMDAVCFHQQSLITAIHHLPNSNMKRVDGGQGPFAVLSFFILGAWTLVDPGFHQRVMSASAPGIAKRGVLVATICFMVSDFLTMTAGIYAIDRLHPLPTNHVSIFPIFADLILPSGLKAIFFMGLIGVTISSHVGYTLVSGATMGRDILAKGLKNFTSFNSVKMTRIGIVITSAFAALIAFWVHSVLAIWYTWSGIMVGALLLPVLASYRSRWGHKFRSEAILAGMIVAFIVSFSWMSFGMRTDNPELNVFYLGQTFSLGTLIPALITSLAVTYGASLFVWKFNHPTQGEMRDQE